MRRDTEAFAQRLLPQSFFGTPIHQRNGMERRILARQRCVREVEEKSETVSVIQLAEVVEKRRVGQDGREVANIRPFHVQAAQ